MSHLQTCAFQYRWCGARCPAYGSLRKSYVMLVRYRYSVLIVLSFASISFNINVPLYCLVLLTFGCRDMNLDLQVLMDFQ